VRIYTLGHGTRDFDELVETLAAGSVEHVADVRRFPESRRNPQFGRELLGEALAGAGVSYTWMPSLGGRRPARPGPSRNPSWQVAGFRAYADYMDSDEFLRALGELLELAARAPTAYLCAETHWSKCHRRLISDKLTTLGHEVVHLITPTRQEPHRLPPFVRVEGAHLRYDLPVA
jgi:uncharacterized protein (DUF488 family)